MADPLQVDTMLLSFRSNRIPLPLAEAAANWWAARIDGDFSADNGNALQSKITVSVLAYTFSPVAART